MVVHYYHIGSAQQPLLAFAEPDVVHFRSYNPANEIRGLSRLEPLRASLVTEDAIRRAQQAWYLHGLRPSVILSHPKVLGDDASRRIKTQVDANHSSVDNWGKSLVLEEGMTATPLQMDAQQMELIASLKLTREEACALFDVPPPAVQILDRATFSNITEQMRSLYRETIAARLGKYESVLDSQLRPDFGDNTLYQEFLLDEVLRGSFEQRASAYETMFRIAGMTPGEIRNKENLPYLGPDTDRLYVNAATLPLGTSAGANPPGEEVEIKPQIIKAATVRTLMGRVGAAESMHDVNPALLVAGLNGESKAVLAAYQQACDAEFTIDEFRGVLRRLATGGTQ
jgi:phage portal protein BeeE